MKNNRTGILLPISGALLCAHCVLPSYEFDEDLEGGDGDGGASGGLSGDGDGDSSGGMTGDGDSGGTPGAGGRSSGGGSSSGGTSSGGGPSSGGAPGDGGASGDGGANTGGTAGSSSVLYQVGDALTVNPDNSLGARGFFYTMMDGWDPDTGALLDDGSIHTVLSPQEGFDSEATQPCVSGTMGLVDTEHCHDEVCGYSIFWGGGLGLNLNEESQGPVEPLDISAIEGFRFHISGETNGAAVRFKVKELSSENDYCIEIPLNEDVDVPLDSLQHNCWGTGAMSLDRTQVEALQWQIVTSESLSYVISDFCIEYVEFY